MAFANHKIARGLNVRHKQMNEISEGDRPALSLKVAPYLPILETIGIEGDPIVIKAGTLIALDAWMNIVPAAGVASATIAYSQTDIDLGTPGYDAGAAEGAGTAVASLPTSFTLAANLCIGYAAYDYIQNMELNGQPNTLNYQMQTVQKGIVCNYMVEYPISHANQMLAQPGELVIPDNARPGYWKPFKAATELGTLNAANVGLVLNNVVGKVMRVDLIAAIDYMDKVETVPGFGLPGRETLGIPLHLATAIADSGNLRGGGVTATYKAIINFNV